MSQNLKKTPFKNPMNSPSCKKAIFIQRNSTSKGGLEKSFQKILKVMLSKGYDLTLLCEKSSISHVPQVKKISLHSYFNFTKLFEFDIRCSFFCKKFSHDLIFSMERTSFQTHMRLGNGLHISYLEKRKQKATRLEKLLWSVHPMHRLTLHLEKKAFYSSFLKKILTNSEMVQKELLHHYPNIQAQIEVLHNSVEWSELEKPFLEWPQTKNIFRQKYPFVDKHCFTFLFVGHNYKRKGFCELLEGMKFLKNFPFQLFVVGHDRHMSFYKQLVQKEGFEKKIHFFGPQNPLPFYQYADAIVIPSIYDPFANVTLEALAMGLFVVSSPFNGGKEVLCNKTGTVIENLYDPKSVKNALEIALYRPKTEKSAHEIRASVAHLDDSIQLPKVLTWLENF